MKKIEIQKLKIYLLIIEKELKYIILYLLIFKNKLIEIQEYIM